MKKASEAAGTAEAVVAVVDVKKPVVRGARGKKWYALRKTNWDLVDWDLNDAALGRLNGCSREAVRQQRAKRGIARSPHWHEVKMENSGVKSGIRS